MKLSKYTVTFEICDYHKFIHERDYVFSGCSWNGSIVVFGHSSILLPQQPVQAGVRDHSKINVDCKIQSFKCIQLNSYELFSSIRWA